MFIFSKVLFSQNHKLDRSVSHTDMPLNQVSEQCQVTSPAEKLPWLISGLLNKLCPNSIGSQHFLKLNKLTNFYSIFRHFSNALRNMYLKIFDRKNTGIFFLF